MLSPFARARRPISAAIGYFGYWLRRMELPDEARAAATADIDAKLQRLGQKAA
jgi:hypothetical protein